MPVAEKTRLVGKVFRSVAGRYDLMNDLMSLGVHRLWKRYFVATAGIRPAMRILDLAGGTGDIAALLLDRLGADGRVVLADIYPAMLQIGRDRLLDRGEHKRLACVEANAEALPFAEHEFDRITMAFGLRNVTDMKAALDSMYRVLKPGGRCLVLEFSHLTIQPLKALYDAYSFKVLPELGARVAGDRDSYQYLVESIRKHPDQDTLRGMFEAAGFVRCDYRNLNAGLVAIHSGWKF